MIIDKLNALFRISGTNSKTFCVSTGKITQPNYSQKGKRNSYYIKEGIEIAEFTNTKLAFINENNEPVIIFDVNDLKE